MAQISYPDSVDTRFMPPGAAMRARKGKIMKPIIVAALGLALTAGTARAQSSVSLGFGSLPTAQGWTFVYGPDSPARPQTDFFSLTPGPTGMQLAQNTSTAGQNVAYYTHAVTLAPTGDFTIRVDATLTSSDSNYPFGFAFGLTGAYVAIGGSLESYSSGEGVLSYTAPAFSPMGGPHSYLLARSAGVATFSEDGTTLFSRTLTGGGDLIFGDTTRYENAVGAYSRVEFASDAVPELSTWAMLVTGFGLVGAILRRRGAMRWHPIPG